MSQHEKRTCRAQSVEKWQELGILKRSDADVTVKEDGTVLVVFAVEDCQLATDSKTQKKDAIWGLSK